MSIWWIAVVAYLAGYLWGARFIAIAILEDDAQRELQHRYRTEDAGKPLVDGGDRAFALGMGSFAGLFWPLIIIYAALSPALRAPSEIAYAQKMELERLRKQAAEYRLPMGDEKP